MLQIKRLTAPQKMPNFQFSGRANWPWREKILSVPQRGQKIIVNQGKRILVIVSIKPFTSNTILYFKKQALLQTSAVIKKKESQRSIKICTLYKSKLIKIYKNHRNIFNKVWNVRSINIHVIFQS